MKATWSGLALVAALTTGGSASAQYFVQSPGLVPVMTHGFPTIRYASPGGARIQSAPTVGFSGVAAFATDRGGVVYGSFQTVPPPRPTVVLAPQSVAPPTGSLTAPVFSAPTSLAVAPVQMNSPGFVATRSYSGGVFRNRGFVQETIVLPNP